MDLTVFRMRHQTWPLLSLKLCQIPALMLRRTAEGVCFPRLQLSSSQYDYQISNRNQAKQNRRISAQYLEKGFQPRFLSEEAAGCRRSQYQGRHCQGACKKCPGPDLTG